MKNIALISLFALAFILVAASDSYACSCFAEPPGTPLRKVVAEAKTEAGAVFVGKVISKRAADESKATVYVKLAVSRSWKGLATIEIEILTAENSAMCGVDFEVGKEYIVYANKGEDDALSANNCSRTLMISGKSKDERYLGKRQAMRGKKKK